MKYTTDDIEKIIRFDETQSEIGFIVHLEVLFLCNYYCEYCYARAHNKFDSAADKKCLDKIIETLKCINFKFSVSILGGEPSIFPHLNYLLCELRKIPNLNKILVITNGKKLINQNIVEKIDYMILSMHSTQIKDIAEFKKSIDYYRPKLKQITCIYQHKFDNMIKEIFDYIKPQNIEMMIEYGFDVNFITYKSKLPEWIYKEYLPYIKQYRYNEFYFKNGDVLKLHDIEYSEMGLRNIKGMFCELKELDLSFKQPTVFKSVCGNNISFTDLNINQIPKCQICTVSHCNCQSLMFGDKFCANK